MREDTVAQWFEGLNENRLASLRSRPVRVRVLDVEMHIFLFETFGRRSNRKPNDAVGLFSLRMHSVRGGTVSISVTVILQW